MPADPERSILEALAEDGATPVVELADRLDRHPVTVERQCYDLRQEGHITMTASMGVYELTEQGRSRLRRLTDREERTVAP